jgi:geranylgeranyl reductase family protein
MKQIEQVDVLIVGSGPAGTSTALHLVQADRSWAGRIVVVDKAIHPREKLCGGGVTHLGLNVLSRLGLNLEPQHFPVRQARLVYQDQSYIFHGNPAFSIIRRDEFDHWLVQTALAWGVSVRQGETVQGVTPHDEYVEVETDKVIFQARVLVAADGSRSKIRQWLKWDDQSRVARLLEVLTPEDAHHQPEFQQHMAIFDFSHMTDGLQGYYWDFPSLVKGQPMMNRGVFDSRVATERPKVNLVNQLRLSLAERDRNLDDYKLKGHPIRWFDPRGRFAIPRVILAGDAAGADPLFGEGISFALGYGDVAAAAIVDAFKRSDFSFAGYKKRILSHTLLKHLTLRVFLARLAYTLKYPWLIRMGWRLARLAIRFTPWRNPNYIPAEEPPQLLLDY